MPSYIDLTGCRFGRLKVLKRIGTYSTGGAIFQCCCDCGKVVEVRGQSLRQGHTQSCGCYNLDVRRQVCIDRNTTHGLAKTRTYHIWSGMIQRCLNKQSPHYHKYGARGIAVCDKWLKFENFYADMGLAPLGLSIDRINSQGNYEPQNCRWATQTEQQNNRKDNRRLTLGNETFTLAEWAHRTGIGYRTISRRLEAGWPLDRALSELPVRGRNQHSKR